MFKISLNIYNTNLQKPCKLSDSISCTLEPVHPCLTRSLCCCQNLEICIVISCWNTCSFIVQLFSISQSNMLMLLHIRRSSSDTCSNYKRLINEHVNFKSLEKLREKHQTTPWLLCIFTRIHRSFQNLPKCQSVVQNLSLSRVSNTALTLDTPVEIQ